MIEVRELLIKAFASAWRVREEALRSTDRDSRSGDRRSRSGSRGSSRGDRRYGDRRRDSRPRDGRPAQQPEENTAPAKQPLKEAADQPLYGKIEL